MNNEQAPQLDQSPEAQLAADGIISSVPGVSRPEAGPVAQAPTGEAQPGGRDNPVIADNGEFRGDPSRVIGHPANKMTNMSQAYGDHLRNQGQ